MIRTILVLSLLTFAPLAAQQRIVGGPAPRGEAPAPPAIDNLSDEFDGAASLGRWRSHGAAEGWPEMIRTLGIDGGGVLRLEPTVSGWYADFRAPFLFQEVDGDFVATTRVRARGTGGDLPSVTWSLAGLMVREPRATTAETWEPRAENWLFATTGIAARAGQPVLETKTTVNGRSALNLHPVPAGWLELRIVRVRADFLVFYRPDGAAQWTLQERFYRPDLPRTLQVGVNAYSGWALVPELWNDAVAFNRTVITDRATDLAAEFDYVRFDRPRVPDALRGARLSDYRVPAADLVAAFAP
jgi:regulation of enolase protein 1 (concanavalin A-like superfamily)